MLSAEPDADPARVGHHWLDGRDARIATPLLFAAARRATERHAHAEATARLRQLVQVGDSGSAGWRQAHWRLAQLLDDHGSPAEALTCLNAVADHACRAGDISLETHARAHLASSLAAMGRVDEARIEANRARSPAEEVDDDRLWIGAALSLGIYHLGRLELDEASAVLELALARGGDTDGELASLQNTLALVRGRQGR